ncbi:hypothetical protein N752_02145 [Desulforamulus aquiferis]|nr:EamA family transporter [Desulforamulus aquiferis]RYD06824.1 hypothetical protein N752_02145 [Desulforamulus aquiferis]
MSKGEQGSPGNVSSFSLVGLVHLLIVYIVWGSTYLAIRIGVREGSGFPPFMMGASRLLAAGCILLIAAALLKQCLKISRKELSILAISGVFLWVGGNGLVMWAEQHADSGYAALLVATAPMWVAVIEAILDRKLPSWLLAGSLLTGFVGLILLSVPVLTDITITDAWSMAALLLAPMCWAIGSVWQRRNQVSVGIVASSGYQQLFGGIGFALVALLSGEPLPSPTAEAWWAWGYLLIFGSLAFTSYIFALRLLPTSVVMTYAYVNPVVAVFLGWLILQEGVTVWTIGGTALVLLGVAGAFYDQKLEKRRTIKCNAVVES